jgi:MFS family permease
MTGTPDAALTSHPDFMRLWIAQGVSALGGRFTRTALPMVAIGALAANPTEVSILSALGLAPAVMVGLFAGGWIDRQAKRPLLVAMDITRAVILIALPLAWALGALNIWLLYLAAALSGAASTVFQTADNAYLPALIGKGQLLEGNAKLETTESVAEIAGPSLAGVVIQALGWPLALMIDAASYLWSALWLLRIANPGAVEANPAARPQHILSGIALGMRLCWTGPSIRPLLAAGTLQSGFGGFFFALYMLFVLKDLNLGEGTVGLIIGVGGIGALLGAVLVEPAKRAFGFGPTLLLSLATGQIAMLLIPLSAVLGPMQIPALIGHQLVSDGALTVFFILSVSLRQSIMPQNSLARAQSAFNVTEGASTVLGALTAGALAEWVGTPTAIMIGAIGGLLAVLPIVLSPLWKMHAAFPASP